MGRACDSVCVLIGCPERDITDDPEGGEGRRAKLWPLELSR